MLFRSNGSAEVLKRDGVLPIAEAARAGDVVALRTFERTVEWLAVALANAVTVTGPQRIVLFGGIARNGDLLMAPLRDAFQKALLNIYMGRVDLTVSALPDDDAAIASWSRRYRQRSRRPPLQARSRAPATTCVAC